LLQTPRWRARLLRQRLGRLAWQVGEQPPRLVAEVANGFRFIKEPLKGLQKCRKFRANGLDLIRGHKVPSQG
jgi:hypothetical protein